MILALGITLLFLGLVYSVAWPLGRYIACVIETPEEVKWIGPLKIVEQLFSRSLGQIYTTQMTWKEYFFSFASFHALGALLLWAFFRFQAVIASPFSDLSGDGSFNAAISFVTNTNWQSYVPETDMSWVVNMIGITTQQFLSASVGISLLCVLGRAFRNEAKSDLGNFWRDITRFSILSLIHI